MNNIPFFFVESNRHYQSFLSYEEAGETSTGAYATSFLQSPSNDGVAMSRYYLHKDEKTEETIQALYSQIFESIETNDDDR
ncbi:hypothetical protein R0K17_02975 [Planococcus sp. SIMBA_143]